MAQSVECGSPIFAFSSFFGAFINILQFTLRIIFYTEKKIYVFSEISNRSKFQHHSEFLQKSKVYGFRKDIYIFKRNAEKVSPCKNPTFLHT